MAANRLSFNIGAALAEWADTQGKALLTTAARAEAPKDTGTFASRLYAVRYTQASGAMRLEIRSSARRPLVPWVLFGTRPHMPPVDALRGWAERHGMNPWAVAMSIKKKGTRPNPFALRAMTAIREEARAGIIAAIRDAIIST